MSLVHRIISAGFAICALASASVPTVAWTMWPDADVEWSASVARPLSESVEAFPAPRDGHLWWPAHWETIDGRSVWVAGQWIDDDEAAAPHTTISSRR